MKTVWLRVVAFSFLSTAAQSGFSVAQSWTQPAGFQSVNMSQILLGAAIGFISDNEQDVLECDKGISEDDQELMSAARHLAEALKKKNLTDVSVALDDFAHFIKSAPSTKEHCQVDLEHLHAVLSTLKQFRRPKALIAHVTGELINDGEKIFGELAMADHRYLGGENIHAGEQLGMALRRILVGELPNSEAADGQWKAILAGAAVGFVSDDGHLVTCGLGLLQNVDDFKQAGTDLEHGLKDKNLTKVVDALEELGSGIQAALSSEATCKIDAGHLRSILAEFRQHHGKKDLISHLVDDGEKIFSDLAAADHAYLAGDALTAGQSLGMALRRMLVAENAPKHIMV